MSATSPSSENAPKPGSPRLRPPRQHGEHTEEQEEVISGIRIGVRYAETGDSQVLYFSETATVEELKRQVMEYAEHGVSCKMNSMILLQEDGTSLVKTSTLLASLASRTIFMFSRETLLKNFVPTVALEDFKELEIHHGERPKDEDADAQREYDAFRKELCERCLSRCRVQIESGTVALKNLVQHSSSVLSNFRRFATATYEPYAGRAESLKSLEKDLEDLNRIALARPVAGSMTSSSLSKKTTLLDALPKEKIMKWAEEASRQHALIEEKFVELQKLATSVEEGCDQADKEWEQVVKENSHEADAIDQKLSSSSSLDNVLLSDCVQQLKTLKENTTRSLFPTLLRAVSLLQSKIQDLSNKAAALKEAIIVQEQKVAQVVAIKTLPEAYKAALREADRRRQFAAQFSLKVQQLTDYIAKERDRELEKREQFHKLHGKVLPPELVPGLTPFVFPVCEVTQRPIDPVLFANILEYEKSDEAKDTREGANALDEAKKDGELLFEAQDLSAEHELSAMEVLEMQAENEFLRGQKSEESSMFAKLKQTHEAEVEQLKRRIAELEIHLTERAESFKAVTEEFPVATSEKSPSPSPPTAKDQPIIADTVPTELTAVSEEAVEEEKKGVQSMEPAVDVE